jgi:hypothetical protein
MARELLATACASEDFKEVERILQDEHVDVDVDYQGYFSDYEDTLLLRAAELGELGIVKLLLKRGADANLENEVSVCIPTKECWPVSSPTISFCLSARGKRHLALRSTSVTGKLRRRCWGTKMLMCTFDDEVRRRLNDSTTIWLLTWMCAVRKTKARRCTLL